MEESCIIVVRCADYALADFPNVVSVFISADEEEKIKRLAKVNNLPEAKARDLMIKTDKKRSSYYNNYSSKKWGDAVSYELCLNSSSLGQEGCVDIILDFAKKKQEWLKK